MTDIVLPNLGKDFCVFRLPVLSQSEVFLDSYTLFRKGTQDKPKKPEEMLSGSSCHFSISFGVRMCPVLSRVHYSRLSVLLGTQETKSSGAHLKASIAILQGI